jgi:hypothetical protein
MYGALGRTRRASAQLVKGAPGLVYALLNVTEHDVGAYLHLYASGLYSTSSTSTPVERRPASQARTRKYSSIFIASAL